MYMLATVRYLHLHRDAGLIHVLGERAPMGMVLNTGPAAIPEHWMLCDPTYSLRSNAVADLLPHDGTPFRTVVERKDGTPADGQWCVYIFISSNGLNLIVRMKFVRGADRCWSRCAHLTISFLVAKS